MATMETLHESQEKVATSVIHQVKEGLFSLPKFLASDKYVHHFKDGSLFDRELLGGKGSILSEMTRMGLPVPPGFIISAEAYKDIISIQDLGGLITTWKSPVTRNKPELPTSFTEEIRKAVKDLEKNVERPFFEHAKVEESTIFEKLSAAITGTKGEWKRPQFPLLLAVRSGSSVSMGGMMDTVLNVGMNDKVLHMIIEVTDNPQFAYDAYRRFLRSFGTIVYGISKEKYDAVDKKWIVNSVSEADNLENLKNITASYKLLVGDIPEDPFDQLMMAIVAVFRSWNNPRAVSYREIYGISHSIGTAVIIQDVVFGNMNSSSGAGLCFTRNPCNGENALFGEYYPCSEGDVIGDGSKEPMALDQIVPSCFESLTRLRSMLESKFRDIQAIEFVIENNNLYILQARIAQRSIQASIRAAVDFVEEGLLVEREALLTINANQLGLYRKPTIDTNYVSDLKKLVIGSGFASAPGAAVGKLVFTIEDAISLAGQGESVILCREFASVDDILGFEVSEGLVAMRSGVCCHACALLRDMAKVAVTGVGYSSEDICAGQSEGGAVQAQGFMKLDVDNQALICCDGSVLRKGDIITIDGSTGVVFRSKIPLIVSAVDHNYKTVLRWANHHKRIDIMSSVSDPSSITKAVNYGADGIGVLNTEYMFSTIPELQAMQKFILSDSMEERQTCMDQLLPMQIEHLLRAFHLMRHKPIVVRLLYPSLNHFLPENCNVDDAFPKVSGLSDRATSVSDELREYNPLLGCKGGRLSILYPQITYMQVRAILSAACSAASEGISVHPSILIPFISSDHEILEIIPMIQKAAEDTFDAFNSSVEYSIGILIEVPRACMKAKDLSLVQGIDFVCFDTKMLTEMTFGISMEDSMKLRQKYREKHIFRTDPFSRIDEKGVGKLMRSAIEIFRSREKPVRIGVCGCHSGDSDSIQYFQSLGVEYISASPNEVPVAKLAAAQAQIISISKANEVKRRIYEELDMPWGVGNF